jgi:hypothetical protein
MNALLVCFKRFVDTSPDGLRTLAIACGAPHVHLAAEASRHAVFDVGDLVFTQEAGPGALEVGCIAQLWSAVRKA